MLLVVAVLAILAMLEVLGAGLVPEMVPDLLYLLAR
jgi:hypothetical protein